MNTLRLTDDELRLVRSALQSYLRAFGHDQAELLHTLKSLIVKVSTPDHGEPGEPGAAPELIG